MLNDEGYTMSEKTVGETFEEDYLEMLKVE